MAFGRKQKLVLVGNGMAGMRFVEELLTREPGAFDIEVFGAEPHTNYNRILLSSVLAREKRIEDIVLHPREWYARNGVALHTGDPVVSLDRKARTISTASGVRAEYDKLVIATGSRPLVPPMEGLELPGVSAFRGIADLDRIEHASCGGHRAVVVGGGLLGLEAAHGLNRRGMRVTVLHLMPTLMERQLDEAAALFLRRDLESRGIEVVTRAETESIVGEHFVEGVRLSDGRELIADLVVFAIGVRPNVELVRRTGLEINRGLIVDDEMRTNDPAVFAVGECVEHRGQTFGLVGPLWEQARVCAAAVVGDDAVFRPPPVFTSLKIAGVDVFSAGALRAADEADEEITLRDAGGVYKKLVLREGRLVGAVLYGDIADGPWFVELMRSGGDVSAMRDSLVFGRALAPAA
jgi:nitrite reductase (NADH) large subunit